MHTNVDYSLDVNTNMKLDTGDERPLSPVFELKKEPIITTDPQKIPSPGEHFARYQFPTIKKERETDSVEICSAPLNHDCITNNHHVYTTEEMLAHSSCTMTVAEQQVNARVFTANAVMPTMMMPTPNNGMMMASNHDMHTSVIYPDMRQRKPRSAYASKKKQWGNAERGKLEQIIEQRSKEWREKQVLWRSCQRQYTVPNSRYATPSSSTMGHTMINQPYKTAHYPPRNEHMFYDRYQGNHRQEVTMASVEPMMIKPNAAKQIQHHLDKNLIIKDVVSLADNDTKQEIDNGTGTILKRRCKRPRKSYEELDTTETEGSDTDENTKSGKYISDVSQPFINIPDDHQVAHINGLLSLPSNRETRYGITYGELKRRCNPPESLTRVDLVAYVRHSKSSGRNLLDKYHIASANRNARTTILSKMCENEARILADGIMKMNTDFFPSNVLAKTSSENLKNDIKADISKNNEENGEMDEQRMKDAVKEKLQNIEVTRSMLKEIYDLLLAEKESCHDMKMFELASHTFGTTNLMNHLKLFDRFFEDYQDSLSCRKRKTMHSS